LIPYETFLLLMELQEDALLAEFDRLATKITTQNAAFTDAEVEADVATAVAESRRATSGT
jgi:hypothetical protein